MNTNRSLTRNEQLAFMAESHITAIARTTVAIMVMIMLAIAGYGWTERNADAERFTAIPVVTVEPGTVAGATEYDLVYTADVTFRVDGSDMTEEMLVPSGTTAGQALTGWWDTNTNSLWQPSSTEEGVTPLASIGGHALMGGVIGFGIGVVLFGAVFLWIEKAQKAVMDRRRRSPSLIW